VVGTHRYAARSGIRQESLKQDEPKERGLAERFTRHADESAFRALYRLHTPLLYRIARRMVGDPERAAEVVQDTWICAAQKLPAFRWESSLSTWLAGIAINRSREEIRRRNAAEPTNAEPVEVRTPSARVSDRIDLERAIDQLPNGYREVLLLHDVEGYTHEEIGQALNIEPGTSRSQLARARAAMRAQLEPGKDSHDSRI
jgi:RNA polymerase sigma factor (sigma-70 family)